MMGVFTSIVWYLPQRYRICLHWRATFGLKCDECYEEYSTSQEPVIPIITAPTNTESFLGVFKSVFEYR